jgi:hypothetical protein
MYESNVNYLSQISFLESTKLSIEIYGTGYPINNWGHEYIGWFASQPMSAPKKKLAMQEMRYFISHQCPLFLF